MRTALTLVTFLAFPVFASSTDGLPTEPTTSIQRALVELDNTLLQFSCDGEGFKIQKTLFEKPEEIKYSIVDANGAVLETSSEQFQCPSDQIDLTKHCVKVQCVKVISLSPEEAMRKEGMLPGSRNDLTQNVTSLLDSVDSN